jgi:hypothetical protein
MGRRFLCLLINSERVLSHLAKKKRGAGHNLYKGFFWGKKGLNSLGKKKRVEIAIFRPEVLACYNLPVYLLYTNM